MLRQILSNPTFAAAKIALDGLSLRQNLIAQNIANVDTPNYHAQETNFEKTLQLAMQTGERVPLTATQEKHIQFPGKTQLFQVGTRQGGTERADGNNVDIDLELTQLTETGIRYQAITKTVSQKYSLFKTLSTGG
jgi:flagellar basal-body rod protein FlgB